MNPEFVRYRENGVDATITHRVIDKNYVVEAVLLRHYYGERSTADGYKGGKEFRRKFDQFEQAVGFVEWLTEVAKMFFSARNDRADEARELEGRARDIRKEDMAKADEFLSTLFEDK